MTKAQKRLVARIKAGETLIGFFDVWGGYWWELSPSNDRVPQATVECLLRSGEIVAGNRERVCSGCHETRYSLAKAA